MSTSSEAMQNQRRQQRLILRCAFNLLLDEISELSRRHDGDLVRCAVLLAITQATRPVESSAEAPSRPRRPISVRATAQSLGLAYETTRRKVAELQDLGLCVRDGPSGVRAAPGIFEGETYATACAHTLASIRRRISELRTLGFDFAMIGPGTPRTSHMDPDARVVAALCDAFVLRLLEAGAAPHGSIVNGAIATTMLVTNAEPLMRDPVLAWRYAGAETPPPDALRSPASITQIAARLGLSHETVRRRVKSLVDADWAQRVPGGYLYPAARMQSEQMMQVGLVATQRFLQLLQALQQAGVELTALEPA